jgi:lipocalin
VTVDIVSTYHAKKQAGLCVQRSCRNPSGKHVRCDQHHARSLVYQKGTRLGRNKARYYAKKSNSVCIMNGCNNPATDCVRCNPCQAVERDRVKRAKEEKRA